MTSLADYSQDCCKGMCVIETNSSRILYNKNENLKLPMASTTKIMTAITAIENCKDISSLVKIPKKAVGVTGTSLYLKENEELSLKDLLYGLMLISGNDASVAIGEYVGKGVKNFIEMMNLTAKKIGALNSHFENTHGLDSKNHYTTAYDLALITSYAMKNPIFKEIVSTKNIKIKNTDGKTRYLKNKNKLLNKMEGCCGVKTGFTNDAGRCLVSSCERNGMNLVCVVLNCAPMFEYSQELLEKAFDEYKLIDLTCGYAFKNYIEVENGRKNIVKISTKNRCLYPLKMSEIDKITYQYEILDCLDAPVKKGEEVGEVKIFIDKKLHFSEKIYTIESVRRNSILNKIIDLIDKW